MDSGFRIADSITILGMNLKSDLSNLSDSHSVAILRIRKIINFWQRFNLSLPGRIGIVKNLLLSQINYTGCFIMPTPEQIRTMSSLIENFTVGRLNISKNRYYLPKSVGGLGLIKIDEFLIAQQVTWLPYRQGTTGGWISPDFLEAIA